MWRNVKVSYIQYSAEMGDLLRKCLKEPFRTKAINRNLTHIKESKFSGGAVQSRTVYESMEAAFKDAGAAQK
eukprot:GDKH01020049.1.p1 GENE.GDKH01020049.1~~GDKH01020049.1.p1  ORF type:complete len:72 (+),score=6.02 GDKH01020049.1:162-377(+)